MHFLDKIDQAECRGVKTGVVIGIAIGVILGMAIALSFAQARDNDPCSRYATHSIAWERCIAERDPCRKRQH